MGRVAVDFGTGNTVVARFNEATGEPETLEIPGITTGFPCQERPDEPERLAHVVPSLIHYSEQETLIGDQVLSRGLAEHPHTMRWMKPGIAQGHTQRRKTPQGHKGPAQAGEDFLTRLLNYASDRVSLAEDEFTFTAPVEAFENFQDWLLRVCERVGLRRVRLLDEPTASVLGYRGAARGDERFVVFDFGCGTLDVSAVRIDLAAAEDCKAVQLGKAGADLGGMFIDGWLADDFVRRHGVEGAERKELEALILRAAEATKIALSEPGQFDADMAVLSTAGGRARALRTAYRRCCPACCNVPQCAHQGAPDPSEGCLGCILAEHEFAARVRETVQRAMMNAAAAVKLQYSDVAKALATGGTSLMPCVQRTLHEMFDGRVEAQSPFDAVARGACQGIVLPILQHDYAIEGFNRQSKKYVFVPLFEMGTEYPTPPEDPVRIWARGTYDGMVRIGLKVFEVSRVKRRRDRASVWGEDGRLRGDSQVVTEFEHVCLNPDNPTFIIADPPINLARDEKRFLCAFAVDGQRRLLVTVLDNLNGKTILKEHPVVRL